MITKTYQEYLDRLKEIAINGEVYITTSELADMFIVTRDYAKQILYLLRANEKIQIIKPKGRIVGVRIIG